MSRSGPGPECESQSEITSLGTRDNYSDAFFFLMTHQGKGETTPHETKWGKKAIEVSYGDPCPICGSRIDEFGFCACGAGGA